MTGDMLNGDGENADVVVELIQQLKGSAPVYFSLGNHEVDYMEQNEQLIRELENAGAVVLEKEYLDTEINGEKVRIGLRYY